MQVKHQHTGRPSPLPVTQIMLKLNQDITDSFPKAHNDRHVSNYTAPDECRQLNHTPYMILTKPTFTWTAKRTN